MARRTSTTSKSTEAEKAAPEAKEAEVTSTETEAPVATESTEAKAPEKEAEIDISEFENAAKAAVETGDESTGTVAEAEVAKVVHEYRALDGIKAKNRAKNFLNDGMKNAMNEGDIVKARAYLQLSDSMTAGSVTKTEKVPADPTEAFVLKEATLKLAGLLSTPGEGVAEDWQARVDALVDESRAVADQYLAWVTDTSEEKGDEPEVPVVVKNAVKLALGKSAKAGSSRTVSTYTGERRDIGKHITEAFASLESGSFLTVAEIRKFESEEYGTNPPSAGAISARLFPQSGQCTIEGIKPGTNEKGNKGATKA